MKLTNKKMIVLASMAAPLLATSAMAEDWFSGSLSAGYANDYEFRGLVIGNDLIETELKLAAEFEGYKFEVGAWHANFNNNTSGVDEQLNTTVSVVKDFESFDVRVGYVNRNFPGSESTIAAQEFFGVVGAELFAGVRGQVSTYYVFRDESGNTDSWYINPEVSRNFKFCECLNLDVAGGLGVIQNDALGTDGVNHWYLSAALNWVATKNLTVTPYVKFTDADSDNISDITTNADGTGDVGDANVIGGLKATVNF
jgi:hypothetical protein